MKAILVVFLLINNLTSLALAEVEVSHVVIEGRGVSYTDALQNGLVEVLKQTQGVSLSSQKSWAKNINEIAKSSSTSQAEPESSRDVSIDTEMSQKIKEVTQGTIHQYQVLSSTQEQDEWLLEIEVQLKRYKTPGASPHSLHKIAVLPFRSNSKNNQFMGRKYDAKELSRELSQQLVTQLTQSRRFTVLDRDYSNENLTEKKLISSSDAPLEEQIKIGQVLGVDFLLLGTISRLNIYKRQVKDPILDELITKSKASVNIDFRIIVMATRQIKWSDSIVIDLDKQQLKSLIKNGDNISIVSSLINKAAKNIVHSSLDNIYPIKILKAANRQSIYLNQGGKMTEVDQIYDVYTKGEKITDPDSGLAIKIDGEKVASIKVTKVLAKYSQTKLVKGNLADIQAGAIVRLADKDTITKNKKKKRQRVMQPNW